MTTDEIHGAPSPADLEQLARPLIESGRPDLLGLDLATIDWAAFKGRPWARLAVAAAMVATDPRNLDVAGAVRSAQRSFRSRGDRVGLGYAAYVDGTRSLGLGRHREAARRWRQVQELLGDAGPVSCNALSHLSLASWHAGDLADAVALADDAVGLARLRVDRRAEGRALVYLALARLGRGDLDQSVAASRAADRVFEELVTPEDRFEWPLVPVPRAAVAGFRGDDVTARSEADEAVRRAEEMELSWYRGIALGIRAEYCAPDDPDLAMADARAALELLRAAGDSWWENCALRALGAATALAGQPRGARRILEEAVCTAPGVFERARCQLALGEVLVELDEVEAARAALADALVVFRRSGARVVHCQALRAMAALVPDQAAALRAEAMEVAGDDRAFDLVLGTGWPQAASTIEVRCFDPIGVSIDGVPVEFMTENARRTVMILALAGSRGVHVEELAEWLWPSAPADRVGQRIRTVVWQTRKALGSEGWRIQRHKKVLSLDPTNVTVDLLDAIEGSTHAADFLEGRLFGPDRYEPWAEHWIERGRAGAGKPWQTPAGS